MALLSPTYFPIYLTEHEDSLCWKLREKTHTHTHTHIYICRCIFINVKEILPDFIGKKDGFIHASITSSGHQNNQRKSEKLGIPFPKSQSSTPTKKIFYMLINNFIFLPLERKIKGEQKKVKEHYVLAISLGTQFTHNC